jgi:hypothetical protein
VTVKVPLDKSTPFAIYEERTKRHRIQTRSHGAKKVRMGRTEKLPFKKLELELVTTMLYTEY